MGSLVAGILILTLVSGCDPRAASRDAVQPTLAAVESLGLRCGEGVEDNVPSGLVQWTCGGAMQGMPSTVLVDGSQEGVVGITLFVAGSNDPGAARIQFAHLIDAVPPLSTAPVLKDTLTGWTGHRQASTIGGVRVAAECDPTQCVITVATERDALRPLPLP